MVKKCASTLHRATTNGGFARRPLVWGELLFGRAEEGISVIMLLAFTIMDTISLKQEGQ